MPAGHVYLREGPMLASSDRVSIRFHGKGGHGAMPHLRLTPHCPPRPPCWCCRASSRAISTPVLDTAVVSVGRMQAGQAYNVIPETAELELSVRTLSPTVRDEVLRRIDMIAQGQAAAFGMRAEGGRGAWLSGAGQLGALRPRWRHAWPSNCSATSVSIRMRNRCPPARISPTCCSSVPGSYLMVGNGDNGHEAGQPIGPCNVHNPRYDFNDACLPVGASIWVGIAQEIFGAGLK
jgi:hippurate hydrolase